MSFSWDDAEGGTEAGARQLGYFAYVTGWKWVIGTAVSIEDIEREAQRKLNLIVEELRQTFARTKLAQTGYFFLFNGRKELLVPQYLEQGFYLDQPYQFKFENDKDYLKLTYTINFSFNEQMFAWSDTLRTYYQELLYDYTLNSYYITIIISDYPLK